MKIFLFVIFQLALGGYLCAQTDTVRWYRQSDNSIRRKSNNPLIELYPVYNRNELIIVEDYDSKNRLLKRAATIDEKCYAGNYFEFKADMKVAVTGNYLTCGLKDGIWSYRSVNGDTLAKERWSKGEFIEEIIKQKHNSVWGYRLMLNEKEFTDKGIDIGRYFRLSIVLFFKNDLDLGRQRIVEVKLFRGTNLIDKKDFVSDNDFNSFDHYSWYKKNKLKSGDRIGLVVYQLGKDEYIGFRNILVE